MFAARFARELRKASVLTFVLLAACATHGGSPDSQRADRRSPEKTAASRGRKAPNATPTLLTFDWGDEFDANVFAIREEFSVKGDAEHTSRLEARYHLHGARDGDHYVLSFSDLDMKLDDNPIPAGAQPEMIGQVTGLVPSYDIAANGDFIDQRDFGRLQSFAERSYLEQNERLPADQRPPERDIEKAMKSGSSREVLELEAARTWGALVGMWAGVTLTEGKPLISDSSVTIPVINAPVTMHSSFELVRREACVNGARKRDCVRLRATSRPDTSQLAAARQKLRESSGGSAEPLSVLDNMQVEDRYEVLTDPKTLRPRWAEWVRGADVGSDDQNSDQVQSRQSTRTRMIFVYR
jgi:hypothetical protein